MTIIARGAEAIIVSEDDILIKKRIEKGYRIKTIDEKLRKLRTRQEARLLEKASSVVNVPKVIKINEKEKEVFLENIPGKKLSEYLNSFSLKKQEEILERIGENIAKLHDIDIIHSDLTTSNMILSEKERKEVVVFIDFGLGFKSTREEDKAVDIHLLKQALEAKHYQHHKVLFEKFLNGYKKSKNFKKVIERLGKVEARGRYK